MPKPQQTQARTENEKPKMGMGPALTSKQERRLQFKEIVPAIDFFKNVVQYKSVSDQVKKVHFEMLKNGTNLSKANETLAYFRKEKEILLFKMKEQLIYKTV